jgi:hypothetical protein
VAADVITQNSEPHGPGRSCYYPELFDEVLAGKDCWLPPEWRWFRQQPVQSAECCGIFGGNDIEFIAHYADSAVRLIEHPGNQARWSSVSELHMHNVLPEQYLLAACMEHRRQRRPLRVGHVFPSIRAAIAPDAGRQFGYTHLIADAKRDPVMLQRLSARMQREYPAAFERAWRVAAAVPQAKYGVPA